MLKPVITDRIQDHCIIPVSLSISSFSTPKMYRRFRVLRRRIPPPNTTTGGFMQNRKASGAAGRTAEQMTRYFGAIWFRITNWQYLIVNGPEGRPHHYFFLI
jgi:hypothetical protein